MKQIAPAGHRRTQPVACPRRADDGHWRVRRLRAACPRHRVAVVGRVDTMIAKDLRCRDTRRRLALSLIRAEDEIVDRLAVRKPRRQSLRVERLADWIGGERGPPHELVRIFGLH